MSLTNATQSSQRIGVYGGTFDPIHYGHLRPALDVLNQLKLGQVRFIPCYQPVHRATPKVSSTQRCQMIEQAITNQPSFVLDKREIERQGPSYMVDTLASLQQDYPQAGLVLMMGTDAFAKFLQWHNWQHILQLANVAVMRRPGDSLPKLTNNSDLASLLQQRLVTELTANTGQIIEVEVTQLDLSATRLRDLLKHNQSIDYLMPDAVINYIKTHQLYQEGT